MNQTPPRRVNAIRPGAARPAEARIAGHFGELAQGRLGPEGPVALITLPCPELVTRVAFDPGPGPLLASEPVSAKALAAARLVLERLGAAGCGGRLTIERPAAPGLGLGSSTAEILGAVRAVAAAFGTEMAPEEEARLCLAAEGACDPLMMPGPALFASREGRALRALPPLPPMLVVGGIAGPPQATDPTDRDFPDQAALFARIEAALAASDLGALAAATTRSAEENQARNPNPAWDEMRALARRLGAGVVVSHTGPAIGLILPPDAKSAAPAAAMAAFGLTGVMAFRSG